VAGTIRTAQAERWDVCLGLTPTAARWLEGQILELEELTGHPVRSQYKMPGEPDVWPKADVIVVAPATFNTIKRVGARHHPRLRRRSGRGRDR
jgi:hypothetical protein